MDSPFDGYGDHDGVLVFHGDDRAPVNFEQDPWVIAQWDDGRECCAVVKLDDGRFAAWESWEDVTGSGFWADAYGGGAEVHVGSRSDVVRFGLSDEARERLGLSLDGEVVG